MAKLVMILEGMTLKEFPLTKERTTIGRKPHNDIHVENLAVSGEHAVIFTLLNDSFVEDLNSTNGTYVNGQPIKRHLLQNGDIIEIGKHRLRYVNDAPATEEDADFERTMVIRSPLSKAAQDLAKAHGEATRSQVKRPAAAPAVSGRPAESTPGLPTGVIQVLTGPAAGRTLELNKPLNTIGKPGADVVAITRRPTGYFITHVEGRQPPTLNGRILDAQAHPLHDHDIIVLGGVKIEFYLKT